MWTRWAEVASFRESGPQDRHYVVDSVAAPSPSGRPFASPPAPGCAYGMTPPKGGAIRMTRYRHGGGLPATSA